MLVIILKTRLINSEGSRGQMPGLAIAWLIKNKVESGYEVCLKYVFVSFLRLDPAQLSIAFLSF